MASISSGETPAESEFRFEVFCEQQQFSETATTAQALAPFSAVFQTLDAENLTPIAVIQLENLGAAFLISGPFSASAPTLMKRSSTVPLRNPDIGIGWRKGDSASFMSNTAGGQAIALLSYVLHNYFSSHQCGEVLSDLCSRLLPADTANASVLQLANAAELLAQKLFPLGFGNFLPDRVVLVHKAYYALDMQPPDDLLECLTVEATADLLQSISQALCEARKIVRISGSFAMGHVLGLLLFMFPDDTVVAVEDVIIHEGSRKSIYAELYKGHGPATISLEDVVAQATLLSTSICVERPNAADVEPYFVFNWSGSVGQMLQLALLEIGIACTPEITTNFCNVLVAITNTNLSCIQGQDDNIIPQNQLAALLGPHPEHLIERTCQEVLTTSPSLRQHDLQTAFSTFAADIQERVNLAQLCSCTKQRCAFVDGWVEARDKAKKACRTHRMWSHIGDLLSMGMRCFFVDAGPDASIRFHHGTSGYGFSATDIINKELFQRGFYFTSTRTIYSSVLALCGSSYADPLANSQGSTIYPTALKTLSVSQGSIARFNLVDGRLIFKERYYSNLRSAPAPPRARAKKSIARDNGPIRPSNFGAQTSLLITVKETANCIELRPSVRYNGTNVLLDLQRIIQASIGLQRTSPCTHPSTNPLSFESRDVVLTSVFSPRASKRNAIAIAMVQSDQAAQLFCCEPGAGALLMEECCLDCTLSQADEDNLSLVIVS